KFNGAYLGLFYIIGAFILLIASVNFMNLSTARASHRWKEIGVRKSVGARTFQLFTQFITESLLMAVLALALALLLDVAVMPALNKLIGRQLTLMPLVSQFNQIAAVVVGTLALGLLAGIYPSFYMTSFSSARVLKGSKDGRSLFRSGLVVVQF